MSMRTVISVVLPQLLSIMVSNHVAFKDNSEDRLPGAPVHPLTHVLVQLKNRHYVIILIVLTTLSTQLDSNIFKVLLSTF